MSKLIGRWLDLASLGLWDRNSDSSQFYRTAPRVSKRSSNRTKGAFGNCKAFSSFDPSISNHERCKRNKRK